MYKIYCSRVLGKGKITLMLFSRWGFNTKIWHSIINYIIIFAYI